MKSCRENFIYVIAGCTAVGKTKFAIDFAKLNNAEIISCDSLLVYKDMNIGTAKPSIADQATVRHHCIDLVSPSERFDVSMFISAAQNAIESIISKNKNIVVVGGSGFYLKSFYFPVIDDVKIPESIEEFVNEEFASSGLDGIVSKLISVNDGICPCIDTKNPRRVMAALKRCLATNKTVDEVQKNFMKISSGFKNYQKHTILLSRNERDLKTRILARTKHMIEDGLIDEVKFLLRKYNDLTYSARNAIGYKETMEWIQSPTTVEDLINKIASNTIKLVKKQKTWFSKQIPIDENLVLS